MFPFKRTGDAIGQHGEKFDAMVAPACDSHCVENAMSLDIAITMTDIDWLSRKVACLSTSRPPSRMSTSRTFTGQGESWCRNTPPVCVNLTRRFPAEIDIPDRTIHLAIPDDVMQPLGPAA